MNDLRDPEKAVDNFWVEQGVETIDISMTGFAA